MKRYLIIIGILILFAVVYGTYRSIGSKPIPIPETPEIPAATPPLPVAKEAPKATVIKIRESDKASPLVSVDYPEFPQLPQSFSLHIASSTLGRLADFRAEVSDNEAARQATASGNSPRLPLSTYSFEATWEPALIGARYVSFIERFDSYAGGANENQDVQTFNYDISAGRELSLADLFPGVKDYLSQISKIARKQLLDHFNQVSPGYDQIGMLDDGVTPVSESFVNFTFTDSNLTIYFPKYAVAPGALGEQKVVIPRNSIK